MSMHGSAITYVIGATSLYATRKQAIDHLARPLEQRRFHHHAVEAGRVRAAQPVGVLVVREAEQRHVRDTSSATSFGSMRAMSAITRSGGSTPSALTTWCSGSSASSFPRKKRSTPTSRIVAMLATITPSRPNTTRPRAGAPARTSRRTRRSRRPGGARRGARLLPGLVHASSSPTRRAADAGRPSAAEKALRASPYAPAHRGSTSSAARRLVRAEPDLREQLVERDPQPPVAVEEEQQAEDDQRRP